MAKATKKAALMFPDEVVMNKIYVIREQKIMLDEDLAELYQVETKRLKEAVRRNIERFPLDFMFELRAEEFKSLRSQFATLDTGRRQTFQIPANGFHRARRGDAVQRAQ